MAWLVNGEDDVMTKDRCASRWWMVLAAGFLGACGGNVEVSAGGNGGEGGTGAEGGGTTTTTSNTGGLGGTTGTGGNTGGTGGGTGGNTGGTGGGTGGNTGGTGGGTGGGVACAALGHVDCVGAFPSCVPVYYDECCPDPGCNAGTGCADCKNIQFLHCAPWTDACAGGPPLPCGSSPEWACNGKEPFCEDPGVSAEPCTALPGCVPAYCALDEDCTTDPVCHPVKPDMCLSLCDSVPPPCPDGTFAETDGFCWTGKCIPQDLCSFAQ